MWKRRLYFNFHYLGKPPWDTGIPVPELVDFMANHNAGCALDLGCGTGTNMKAFLEAGWTVDGVDIAFLATKNAKEKIRGFHDRGRVFTSEVTDLEFLEGKYDLIYDIGCFHGLDDQSRIKYVENIERLLNRNGFFLIYGFYKSDGTSFGIDSMDMDRFRALLKITDRLESVDERGRSAVFIEFQRCEKCS